MSKLRSLCGVAVAALVVTTVWAASPASAAPVSAPVSAPASAPVVQTSAGALQGKGNARVDSFLGIPYAAPPVGKLRWRPPQPAAAWTGVRSATSYGPRCAALASTNGPRSDSEDCLYLNVQRPTGVSAGADLPVYVFIHGGGLVNGSSNQGNGAQFVRRTDEIVVSMNYRLGVFGFLGLPGLSANGTGDYGLLDQQAALKWVQRNIAAFGGDPDQVTLGGESAGAFSVCAHLVTRGSRGLFARAMMQSGACYSRPLSQTQSNSSDFAAAAGCTTDVVACLRAAPEARLLDASTAFAPTITSGTDVLPESTQSAVAAGNFYRVPIVNGSNRDEGRTFAQGYIGYTESQYVDWVDGTFGAQADQVLAEYPWPADATTFTPAYLIGAIITDDGLAAGIGGCSALHTDQAFAAYVPTYAYEFDARQGPGLVPIPGYVWGAGHAAELAYLFPSFDNGTPIAPTFDAGQRQLSRDMTQYWGAFVRTGQPEPAGLAAWPTFNDTQSVLSLRPAGRSVVISVASFRAEHDCDFWDALG